MLGNLGEMTAIQNLPLSNWSGEGEQNSASDNQKKQQKKIFGIDKDFFMDLFMPKDQNYQNKIMDLKVDGSHQRMPNLMNHFVFYPYQFPDKEQVNCMRQKNQYLSHKKQREILKKQHAPKSSGGVNQASLSKFGGKEVGSQQQGMDINFVSFIFVLDADYCSENMNQRIAHCKKGLEELSLILIREELRCGYLGQEALKILNATEQFELEWNQKQGQQVQSKFDLSSFSRAESKLIIEGEKKILRQKRIFEESALACLLKSVLLAFVNDEQQLVKINHWIPYIVNQKLEALPRHDGFISEIGPQNSVLIFVNPFETEEDAREASLEAFHSEASLIQQCLKLQIFNPLLTLLQILDENQPILLDFDLTC
mmetsp:Transcript_18146/g.31012  ORF Transcript_18146/g.31012 Transcript_18146/m.31012 type:complete len:369 (+) Transcript_18146:240-1346(+)